MVVTARNLKFREVKEVGQDHTASKWGSCDLKPGSTISKASSQNFGKCVAVHTFGRKLPQDFFAKAHQDSF